jgi:hypothetical protein
MNKILFASACCLISTAALASDWKFASISTDGAVWYVDQESIKVTTEGYSQKAVKAWIKVDYTNVKSEPARERKTLYFFKCNEEQAKMSSSVLYRPDGSVLRSYTPAYATYDAVVPDTVLSAAMQQVCSHVGL